MQMETLHSSDLGFGLVELMIAMLIFIIAAFGIGSVLVRSNQQIIVAEKVLNTQQHAMNMVASTNSVVTPTTSPITIPMTVTAGALSFNIGVNLQVLQQSASNNANTATLGWWLP